MSDKELLLRLNINCVFPDKSCVDGTKVWVDGESGTCSDGCNRCSCRDGVLASTRMACTTKGKHYLICSDSVNDVLFIFWDSKFVWTEIVLTQHIFGPKYVFWEKKESTSVALLSPACFDSVFTLLSQHIVLDGVYF